MEVLEGIEVIVGTYEELTLGYRLKKESEETQKFTSSFTDHSHTASVKTVAISSNGIAATGSSDESIKLFNLRKRVEIGTLLHHEGSVMGLQFFGKNHLFSYSEDGTIAIWKAGSWECLRTLRGHKGPVHSFAVHPSGKLALSCGKDKTLRTWNLMTARSAYITNVKQAVDLLAWSPEGSMYIMVTNDCIDICAFETAAVIQQIHTGVRVSCVTFSQHGLLLAGCEKGQVFMYSAKTFEKLHELQTGTIRVKSMAILESDKQLRLLIASSDGYIKLYDVCIENGVKCELVAEVSTGFRLLSIAVTDLSSASDKSNDDENEVQTAAEAGPSDAQSSDEDSRQSEDSSNEAEDTGPSAAGSQDSRKRKQKCSTSQNIDSKTSRKTSNCDKQRIKGRKKQRKNINRDSASPLEQPVVATSSSKKKKRVVKKLKHKHKQMSS